MLKFDQLHNYQYTALSHLIAHPQAMLWLDMGLGKTVTTLTAINTKLMLGQIRGALVVAPLRVCQTVWEQEAQNWEHLNHLRFARLYGNKSIRFRNLLWSEGRQVFLINYENLPWLVDTVISEYLNKGQYPPFDMAVWDEVSKMKNSTSKRMKAFKKIQDYIPHRVGLTGTPAPNGLRDLHGQFLAVDGGSRLGAGKTRFEDRFFYRQGFTLIPYPESEKNIKNLVADITLDMDSDDYLDMPEFTVNDIMVDLPEKEMKQYKDLENDFFLELDGGEEVEAFNTAALSNKCLQFANGEMYVDEDATKWKTVHNEKIQVLEDIIEEAAGKPILLAYPYRSTAAEIEKRFKAVNLTTAKSSEVPDIVDRWNRGEIPLLIGHPASIGHGLNLQKGGHILVWYGLNWSLDLYDQFNARLHRQGQEKPVICHRILCRGTLDEAVRRALASKKQGEDSIRDAIRRYRDGSKS